MTLDEISLELGPDISLEKGETIILKPTYFSHSPIITFTWEADNAIPLDCPNCKNLVIQPESDTRVNLYIENGTGCKSNDHLDLKVVDVNIYAANTFNPNREGINNSFFLQGNLPYDIARFEIYDRWGNLIFLNKNILANQPNDGWNGTHDGKRCLAGVYIWSALIRYKNGRKEVIAGNVVLSK